MRVANADGKYVSGYNTGKTIQFIAAPVLSSVKNVDGDVLLKWTAVPGAVNYRVIRKLQGSSTWTRLGYTAGTNFLDETAKAGKTYVYSVRCVTKDGNTSVSGYNATGLTITVK